MMDDRLISARVELEQVLVRQFRLLKDLVALTKRERAAMLAEPETVLAVVEDKEALLDSLTLLEDQCRQLVQELSLRLRLRSPETSIQELLPHLEPEQARRIGNLSEGISGLASEARELNRANQAIALTRLEWLRATQSFLISLFLPEAGYQKPGQAVQRLPVAGLGVEFRA